ncbi:MAG: hypothetical protein OXI43_03040 [Candidatus Poribacteria bacterium]|nr:hypothetical protein [Candidatus Poribacteria bacterium]
MSKKTIWGFAALIILLIAAGGFIFWQLSTVQQLKEQLAQDAKLLQGDGTPKVQHVVSKADIPPPAEPGFKWVRHGDHWDKVPVSTPPAPVGTQPSEGEYGVTRQGTRYLKNPAWADRAEAHAIPTGPPLEIDWHTWANLNTRFPLDWHDPKTWEAYRNFWGFDRPRVNPDGTMPYVPVLDNWGTPLQNFRNVSLVVKYSKRIGFRPTPEQFVKHQALVARYEDAQAFGDTATAESLRSQIAALEASAQGELPDPNSYFSAGYGDPTPNLMTMSDEELRQINKEREAVGIRNLYKRLGIEHLYQYYEKP